MEFSASATLTPRFAQLASRRCSQQARILRCRQMGTVSVATITRRSTSELMCSKPDLLIRLQWFVSGTYFLTRFRIEARWFSI
ncbi:unnamed protein product [Sphagnum tenellum]